MKTNFPSKLKTLLFFQMLFLMALPMSFFFQKKLGITIFITAIVGFILVKILRKSFSKALIKETHKDLYQPIDFCDNSRKKPLECICNDIDKQSPGSFCEACHADAGYQYNCEGCNKMLIYNYELPEDVPAKCSKCLYGNFKNNNNEN